MSADVTVAGTEADRAAAAGPRIPAPRRARPSTGTPRHRRLWSATWPKLAALGIVLMAWQAVVWSGWRPDYVLPGPATVGGQLLEMLSDVRLWSAMGTTMRRGLVGFALAVLIGSFIGVAVARVRVLRQAIGSLITGLQTMPSIAWFPLAILLFGIGEQAILFVIVLGAAPSVANGIIGGIDFIPPQLVRAGRTMGASGYQLYRHVVLPAALPTYVTGLKQGWAFAWRSLMAGELLVIIAERPALGAELSHARELFDAPRLMATMIVILVIGMLVDGAFTRLSDGMRARRGLAAR